MSSLTYAQRATQYARDVLAGDIDACEWIRLACLRHVRDIERREWRWHFDAERANRYCQFIELMPHVKGRWDSRTIVLEPWQIFFIASVFGWVDDDSLRRFRKALLVVARGNAKTTMAAALALAVMCLDREPGAEIYSGAKTRDQAKICWSTAKLMVSKTPQLRTNFSLEAWAHAITDDRLGGSFKPLSRDAKVAEGLSVHLGIVDEIHAHPDRQVYDVMLHGMRARRQPLLIEISTEGDDDSGILAEEVDYLKDILQENVEGERFFGLYFTLDKEDDWTSPRAWVKANPNLGVSVFQDELETLRDQALANPGAQASFKTKRCNVRVGTVEGYFNLLAWEACGADIVEDDYIGLPCWGGVDLASESDVAAFMRLYEGRDHCALFGSYYLPGDVIRIAGANRDRYRGWSTGKRPPLILTEGNAIDFARLESDIAEWAGRANPRVVGFDPSQATRTMQNLEASGVTVMKIPQSVNMFSEPMKRMASLIVDGRLRHDRNPILTWMMGNVVARTNIRDEVFPTKAKADKKIDGPVGAMMAINRMIADVDTAVPYHGLTVVG